MHGKLPPFLMLIRLLVLIYVLGRAASLLQSHFNDSLRWQALQKTKPQQKSVYTHKVTRQRTSLFFSDKYCRHSFSFRPLLLMIPFSSTCLLLFLSFTFLFQTVWKHFFKGVWGQVMSDQRCFFWRQERQRCQPTQLHCEPKDCVISITHCSFFLLHSSIHPLACAPPTHW